MENVLKRDFLSSQLKMLSLSIILQLRLIFPFEEIAIKFFNLKIKQLKI